MLYSLGCVNPFSCMSDIQRAVLEICESYLALIVVLYIRLNKSWMDILVICYQEFQLEDHPEFKFCAFGMEKVLWCIKFSLLSQRLKTGKNNTLSKVKRISYPATVFKTVSCTNALCIFRKTCPEVVQRYKNVQIHCNNTPQVLWAASGFSGLSYCSVLTLNSTFN